MILTKTKLSDIPLTLDHNREIPVTIEEADGQLSVTIDTSRVSSKRFRNHLAEFSGLTIGDKHGAPEREWNDGVLTLSVPVSSAPKKVTITLRDQPIVRAVFRDGAYHSSEEYVHQRLNVSEIRAMAKAYTLPTHIPYDRKPFNGFDATRHAPITDLHTHASAQLPASELMEVALEVGIAYPVELLAKAGVVLNEDQKELIDENGSPYKFTPTMKEGLSCEQEKGKTPVIGLSKLTQEQRARITRHFSIPQDKVLSFGQMDPLMYRFRNPLVKNPKIAKDMLLKIAKHYHEQGITYTELSTGAMLDPAWFKEMIEAAREAEEKYGVKLRFLVGVPRDIPPQQMLLELEKVKYVARHPLIAGVDLLGYEHNKTSDFNWALEHIAEWARDAQTGIDEPLVDAQAKDHLHPKEGWNFHKDFVVRVHAGETGKNYGNVVQAANVAQDTRVRVRIAHAIHTDMKPDEKLQIKKLSDDGLVAMELCPLANQAYNNITLADKAPVGHWNQTVKEWFLGSDGAGAVQSTPTQLALSALSCGINVKDLEILRQRESQFISQRDTEHDIKQKAFHSHYGEKAADDAFLKGYEERLKKIAPHMFWKPEEDEELAPVRKKAKKSQPPQYWPEELKGKMPILVAGASGESWDRIGDPKIKKSVEEAMRVLVGSLNPDEVYFCLGRVKNEGVSNALDQAIKVYNRENPTRPFKVVGVVTADNRENSGRVTWFSQLPASRMSIPDGLASFVKEHKGIALMFGGSNFTGDCIHLCDEDDLPFGIMSTVPGATKDAADAGRAHTSSMFENSNQLLTALEYLIQQRGHNPTSLFRIDIRDKDAMKALTASGRFVDLVGGKDKPNALFRP
jgi:adenosine deaminase